MLKAREGRRHVGSKISFNGLWLRLGSYWEEQKRKVFPPFGGRCRQTIDFFNCWSHPPVFDLQVPSLILKRGPHPIWISAEWPWYRNGYMWVSIKNFFLQLPSWLVRSWTNHIPEYKKLAPISALLCLIENCNQILRGLQDSAIQLLWLMLLATTSP